MNRRPAQIHETAAKLAAWGVHAFTASGAVAGFLAWVAITGHDYRAAFLWMAAAVAIDSVDGVLSRWCRVKERIPKFDGALLDNVVDYFTYAAVPAALIYESDLVPGGTRLLTAAAILLASAYQFCHTSAKTSDHFFTGFPSYWNVAALYLFLLSPAQPWFNLGILLFLTAATFVPIRYVYPSRTPYAQRWTIGLGGVWAVLLLCALIGYPKGHRIPAALSLAYMAYYATLSLWLHFKRPASS